MWKRVSPEEARAHVLYGNRGWLAVLITCFLILAVLTGGLMLSVLMDPNSPFRSVTGPALADQISVVIVFLYFAVLPAVCLLRLPLAPEISALVMGVALLIGMGIDLIWPSDHLVGSLIFFGMTTAFTVLILRYLFNGQRPNMTYKHQLRSLPDAA